MKTVYVNGTEISESIPMEEILAIKNEKDEPIILFSENIVLQNEGICNAEVIYFPGKFALIPEEECDKSTMECHEDFVLVYWKTKEDYEEIITNNSYFCLYSFIQAYSEKNKSGAKALAIIAPDQKLIAFPFGEIYSYDENAARPLYLTNKGGRIVVQEKPKKIKR